MNERFGLSLVSDVLKGAKTSKIKSFGFDKLSTYGIMSDYSKDTIKDMKQDFYFNKLDKIYYF